MINFKHISFISFIVLVNISYSQVSVSYSTINNAIQSLAGDGVQISNVTYSTTRGQQVAKFNCPNSYVGLNSGIVIVTGNADFAAGSNTSDADNSITFNSDSAVLSSDSDLSALSNGYLYDKAIVEFDFISNGTDIEFDFVFASEEYGYYENTSYNDVFGFFLSGPGINGPYSNNAINIANVPNTNTPVSVNTINSTVNSNLFNGNTFSYPGAYNNRDNTAFNGFTDVLKARANIQCGETYHIKIAIADVRDGKFDAGVFIGANTFKSDFNIGPLSYYPTPVCNGDNVSISIGGASNYTYEWNNGVYGSGIGLQQINIPSDINNTQVKVIATNSDGCTLEENINLIVHANTNNPPYNNGINNTGEYTYHVQAGQSFCFDIPTFDDISEETYVDYFNTNSAINYSFTNFQHDKGKICWNTSSGDEGLHNFGFIVEDNNACGFLRDTSYFKIRVYCDYCPETIYYENRTPSNNPLPTNTKSGMHIVAGENVDPSQVNGPVNTGNAQVNFHAGKSINLQAGFTAGPGFTAIIDELTCVDECDKCCDNFSGFTYDFIPEFFSPNNDGYNDYWYLPDVQNAFCAYNAQGYELRFRNRWDDIVYSKNESFNTCCPLKTKSYNNDPVTPNISWNGISNQTKLYSWYERVILGKEDVISGNPVPDGVYKLELKLIGCSSSHLLDQTLVHCFGGSNRSVNDSIVEYQSKEISPIISLADEFAFDEESNQSFLKTTSKEEIKEEINFYAYPNPSNDFVNIESRKIISDLTFELYSSNNKLVNSGSINDQIHRLNLKNIENGVYFLILKSESAKLMRYKRVIVAK